MTWNGYPPHSDDWHGIVDGLGEPDLYKVYRVSKRNVLAADVTPGHYREMLAATAVLSAEEDRLEAVFQTDNEERRARYRNKLEDLSADLEDRLRGARASTLAP